MKLPRFKTAKLLAIGFGMYSFHLFWVGIEGDWTAIGHGSMCLVVAAVAAGVAAEGPFP